MTNEQLTQEVMNLKADVAESKAQHEKYDLILKEIKEDVKATKTLAEDVHIMATNMENMQKTVESTAQKVDALNAKEFEEYKENKKIVKQNIIKQISSGIIGFIISVVVFFVLFYLKNK